MQENAMPFIEQLLFRSLFWVILPFFVLVLIVGPARCAHGWRRLKSWLFDTRQEPAAVLNRVVSGLEKSIWDLKQILQQAETTRADIVKNMERCQQYVPLLEAEASQLVVQGDDFGARATLSKLNLEHMAIEGFQRQLHQQQDRITQTRRRLHQMELQLRQYEVGRSILLAHLAEAKSLEQQYALANQFDPFSAIAAWQKAEGQVNEAAQQARAAERVLNDTNDGPLNGRPLRVDPALVDAQLSDLKTKVKKS
jgi:phage shock protein A